MRAMGIGGISVINVENACSSSVTALHGERNSVALGEIEVALVVGMEKMYFEDRSKVLPTFSGSMDVEMLPQIMHAFEEQRKKIRIQKEIVEDKGKGGERSIFMDFYASLAIHHMEKYGSSQRQLAAIAAKNHYHSSMTPLAQYQNTFYH
jgi:acetyl-CoA acetyltransferase